MKAHLFIAIGLLLLAIFFVRGMQALNDPGFGLRELYVLGGFVAGGLLIRQGLKDRRSR